MTQTPNGRLRITQGASPRRLVLFARKWTCLRRRLIAQATRRLMNVVDDNRVPFELPLVVVAARALDIAPAVGVCVMRLLNPLSRALQGGLGMDQLVLGVGNRLVGIRHGLHFSRRELLC